MQYSIRWHMFNSIPVIFFRVVCFYSKHSKNINLILLTSKLRLMKFEEYKYINCAPVHKACTPVHKATGSVRMCMDNFSTFCSNWHLKTDKIPNQIKSFNMRIYYISTQKHNHNIKSLAYTCTIQTGQEEGGKLCISQMY